MSFEAQCPQCMFVSRQFTQPTPCLLHVSSDSQSEQVATSTGSGDYDEPYEFGQLRLNVDRPGPFSLREYVRLRLLRSRLGAESPLLDTRSSPAPPVPRS